MGRIGLCLALVLGGCHSTEAPTEEPRAEPSASPTPSSSAPASNARIPTCRVRESLNTNPGGDSLENVRVWLDGDQAIVTSERQSNPEYGDSSRSGHVTWIEWARPPKERAREVMLPYRAYAAAMYTHVGATRDGLFAYGVAGGASFDLYPQGYAAWNALNPHQDNALPTNRTSTLNFIVMESFHVAPERPVATVAGIESKCPDRLYCDEPIGPTLPIPERSVRVVSLEKPPRSWVVWRAREKSDVSLAPAIAFGESAGAVVFRARGEILFAELGADLEPKTPERLAAGDVGAPAVVYRKDQPIVAWAERATANDPYRIVIFDGSRHELRNGSTSSFAPSIALFEDHLLVAFMQGNAKGTAGKIRLARVPLAGIGDVVDVSKAADLSPGAVNARDPEIAVSATSVTLAWSEFQKSGDSRIQVRRLDCKNP